jgi:hypothetical protein
MDVCFVFPVCTVIYLLVISSRNNVTTILRFRVKILRTAWPKFWIEDCVGYFPLFFVSREPVILVPFI